MSDPSPTQSQSPGFLLIEKSRATVFTEMLLCYLLPAKKMMVLGIVLVDQLSSMTLRFHKKNAIAKQQETAIPAICEGNVGRCRPSGATKM